jgi:hypothetical protein
MSCVCCADAIRLDQGTRPRAVAFRNALTIVSLSRPIRPLVGKRAERDAVLRLGDEFRAQPVTILEGEGKSDYEASSRLGSDALFLGIGIDEADLQRLPQIVYDDFKIYLALDDVFMAGLRKFGVTLKSKTWREERRPRMIASIC